MPTIPPIDPSFVTRGGDWALEAGTEAAPSDGAGFGAVMRGQLASLSDLQGDAAGAARELAVGQAEDPSAAVLAVERARLAMQLAVQVRTKLTDAFNDVMHTQV